MSPATMAPPFGRFFLPGPTEVLPEILAAQTRPMIGHRWWEQALLTVIGPTIMSSFRRSTFGNSVTGGMTV